jgi:hypothetical protein
MTVPYSFANATVSIPLSQLDSNFNTPITLGNTAIQLGNTVTTLNNMTLANVTISSGNVTITNVSVTTANVTTLNAATVIATTANVTTANITTGNVTNMSSGNVAITGGSINGTTLGATTASTANVTTLTTSSTVTINGGTANGVAYLNASKVLTTGSALTFNGTTLTLPSGNISIGASTAGTTLDVFNGDAVNAQRIRLTTSGTNGVIQVTRTSGTVPNLIFQQDASELMRLTSTGLGIGTSSPAYKLDVRGVIAIGDGTIKTGITYTTQGAIGTLSNHSLQILTNSNIIGTFDTSGNLGLGVTPSAWGSTWRVLDAGNLSSFANNTGSSVTDIWHNAFVNSGGVPTYKTTAAAGFYRLEGGTFKWFNASSGTAGTTATFTQVMTLDADGDLGIGTTSPGQKLTVQGGITVTSSATLSVAQGPMLFSYEAPISRIYMGDGTGYSFAFSKRASSTTTDLMTLTDGGNFSLGGTANRGTTVGTNALQIFNGTAPAGTLTNGVSLYSSSGDLFFMDAAGTASRVGFRGVPQSGSAKTGSYTLATTDVGDYIEVGSGGSITIPNATFATGDVVSIFNNTSGNITITCTITTAYIAGTDADKASVTLATRGVATILFISGTVCVISGNVS